MSAQPPHRRKLSPQEDDENHLFWLPCMYILIWSKFVLYKYVTYCLVTERVCILPELGFDDFNEMEKQSGMPLLT